MQSLLDDVLAALTATWHCVLDVQRRRPLVSVEDNYDRLGYAASDVTRDARYSRYAAETVMLRSHTTAGVPPALRALAGTHAVEGEADLLLALPGVCYRRDSIDRLHVGTPHQVDLWRITATGSADRRLDADDLQQMVELVVGAVLPGARWRTSPARHPYTTGGLQVDVATASGWVELAECGLAAGHVLAGAGLDPDRCTGLALGMGLDRALMVRKGIPDIRVLRSTKLRIAAQLLDLRPWRPVSSQPAVRRDLSIVTETPVDAELLGDTVRAALGPAVDDLEAVSVLSSTGYADLPDAARRRLGLRQDQVNVLLRLVLRPLSGTLTDQRANELRDQVYAAVHRGPRQEWATHRCDRSSPPMPTHGQPDRQASSDTARTRAPARRSGVEAHTSRTPGPCRSLRSDESGLVGDDDQLRAVPGTEFHHGMADVGAGGGWAEEQCGADLVIAHALTDERQDLTLSFGEDGEPVSGGLVGCASCGELGDEAARDARREQRLSVGDHANAVQELGRAGVLEQEPAGAGLQALEDVGVGVVGGQDEDASSFGAARGDDPSGGLDAVHPWHADVHEHDVGARSADQLHGLGAGRGFSHHRDVVLDVEQEPEAGPHQLLVVDEQHRDRSVVSGLHTFAVPVGARGSRAVTAKPPPDSGPASSSPPRS
jgi:phenylalanyl-tRNA synthetase alpha chain